VSRSGNKVLQVNGIAGNLDVSGVEVGGSETIAIRGSFEARCVADPDFSLGDPGIKDDACGAGVASQGAVVAPATKTRP
jgi:hypothetical protein